VTQATLLLVAATDVGNPPYGGSFGGPERLAQLLRCRLASALASG